MFGAYFFMRYTTLNDVTVDEYKQGKSIKEIAIEHNYTFVNVYYFLKKRGVYIQTSKLLNVIGDRYGLFTVIKRIEGNSKLVLVKCDCGNEKNVSLNSLRQGRSKSCGCHVSEKVKLKHLKFKYKGLSCHKLMGVWNGMLDRCYNEKSISFKRYGGRGIKVCEKWLDNYIDFYDWAIENNWDFGLEIDRINNNGNYEPSNCRFVTSSVNSRNKNNNVILTINGESKCAAEWAEMTQVNHKTILNRKSKGWSDYDCVYKQKIRGKIKGTKIKPKNLMLKFNK